jgi:Leucine-rich repeat (LRR) protein
MLLMITFISPASSCTEQDRRSLLKFLAGLSRDGGLAASWQPDTDCCRVWEGVTCDENGNVAEVSLLGRGLHGYISPSSLDDLAGLTRLDLSHNALTGSLPLGLIYSASLLVLDVSFNSLDEELPLTIGMKHQSLQVLNISTNKFAAEFPSLDAMANLVALDGSNNSFIGQIPAATLCRASPSLSVLDLSYNRLTGEVSPALADCSMLKVLKVGMNNLSGTLPAELFNMTSLEHLSLANNGLQGELVGALVAKLKNLVTLDLGGNGFHGDIPKSIGQLKKLEVLRLSNNNMSGYLPSSLGNCTHLTTIDLKMNSFSGDLGTVDFSSLPNLTSLDLLYNNFSGVIPESIYSCSNMTALRLSSNHFHGEISSKIGDLKHLSFLSLTTNSFRNIAKTFHALESSRNLTTLFIGQNFWGEAIQQDETIQSFVSIRHLSIFHCSLTGSVPLWLSKLKKLEILDLSNNRLTGPMPSWINSLSNLFYLDLSNNSLTGQIPAMLTEMPMLKLDDYQTRLTRPFDLPVYVKGLLRQYRALTSFPALLNLSSNNFTGVIPSKIGELRALTNLDFSSNLLQGDIPPSICNLRHLQVLDLSCNHLTGPIPEALNKLYFLAKFNVSNNDLEGPIPTGGQMDTFSRSSFDGNPKLCGSMLATCHSAETAAHTIPTVSDDQQCTTIKDISAVAFCAFFGIGVLYDQLVLYRFFG